MTAKTRKQQIEEMLADDPGDPFLRYGLGMEYVSAGDDEAAVRTFAELSAASPNYVPAYLQHGQVLVRLGREDEAKAVFRQGVAVAGRVGDAHAAGEMQGMLDGLD